MDSFTSLPTAFLVHRLNPVYFSTEYIYFPKLKLIPQVKTLQFLFTASWGWIKMANLLAGVKSSQLFPLPPSCLLVPPKFSLLLKSHISLTHSIIFQLLLFRFQLNFTWMRKPTLIHILHYPPPLWHICLILRLTVWCAFLVRQYCCKSNIINPGIAISSWLSFSYILNSVNTKAMCVFLMCLIQK